MKDPIPPHVLNYQKEMNLDLDLIKLTWKEINREEEFFDCYTRLLHANANMQGPTDHKDEDAILNQVIYDSIKNNQGQLISFEIMNPEQRKRKDHTPCGLKNVGNTCYFNSLLQTYFFNRSFVSTILKYKAPAMVDENNKKLAISLKLAQNLQNLFISMIGSDKKYVDPTEVVKSICDDFGNVLPIGDQKDAGEFNHYFLCRIEEALSKNEHQSHIEEEPLQEHNPNLNSSQVGLGGSSIFRQRSSVIHNESLTSKIFFTKTHKCLKYQEINQKKEKVTVDQLNFIPLDVSFGNLYDSWDDFMISQVDFKNDANEQVKADLMTWITEAPETMTFQIQRVQYDKEKAELVKNNAEFNFPEELYIDRYLLQNSEQYLEIRNKNCVLKTQQKQLKHDLDLITQFQNQQDFLASLGAVIACVELQMKNPHSDHPAQVKSKLSHLKETQNGLNQLKTELERSISEKKKSYQDLEKKIQASFNSLMNKKYILQAILVQDGQANSGHYYAYIYDAPIKKWFKFNDIHVTEEQKERVLTEAYGGKGTANAYLLIYVKDDIFKKETNLMQPLRTYRTSDHRAEYLNDGYGCLLSEQQREQIQKENILFSEEIEDYNNARLVDQIQESYARKFEYINEQTRVLLNKYKDLKLKPQITLNFPVFIKQKGANDNLAKWFILDNCVKESTNGQQSVIEGTIKESLKNKIIQKFKAMNNEFKSPPLQLTQGEEASKQTLIIEYQTQLGLGAILVFLVEKLCKEEFIHALQALQYFIKQAKTQPQTSYYYKQGVDFKAVVPIIILGSFMQPKSQLHIPTLELLLAFLQQKHFEYTDHKNWWAQLSIFFYAIHANHNKSHEVEVIIKQMDGNIKNQTQLSILEQQPVELHNYKNVIFQEYEIGVINTLQSTDVIFSRLIDGEKLMKQKFDRCYNIIECLISQNEPIPKDVLESFFG